MAEESSSKKKKDIKNMTGRQKAAVFLVSIGSDISSEIFKYLREDEIETLTFEIARMEMIEPEQKDAILTEFQELMMANQFISIGGIDYARELLEKSLGSQKAIDIINRLTSSLQVRPFDFIRRTDPAHLLNFIQQELPQTIALILAYLDRDLDYFAKDIRNMIAYEIVKRYYYQRGSIIEQLKDDDDLREALKVLNHPEEYRRVLSANGDSAV